MGLHVAGALYTLTTLHVADFFGFRYRESELAPWLSSVSLVAWFVLVALLAGVEGVRALSRLWEGESEPEVGLRLRAFFYVAVACAFVSALVPFAYPAYALWSLLLPRLQRAFPARLRRGLDVALTYAVLVLVVAELALSLAANFWPTRLLVTQSSPAEVRRGTDRLSAGTSRFSFPLNSGGHYDEEFQPASMVPGKTVVVDIGDSFSYGTVPHAFHFTTVAERELPGVAIYNMGSPDLGPADYLDLLVHEALPLKPRLVIVNLFLGDDVMAGPAVERGSSHWYDADRYMVAALRHRLRITKRAKVTDSAAVNARDRMTRTNDDLVKTYPWLADPLLEKARFTPDVFLAIETRNARGVSTAPAEAYQGFFPTLVEMQLAAALARVPLAFMLIPGEFQVDDELWEAIVRKRDILIPDTLPMERDRPQRLVVDWMNRRGIQVLDLLPILRAAPAMQDGHRHLYHLRDTHFNARGNEVAGRALAGFVQSLLSKGLQEYLVAQPDVSLPLRVDIGDSTAHRWMDFGWNADEGNSSTSYAWSQGKLSVLQVPLPTGADIRMDFEVLPFASWRSPRQRVSIVLNGTVVKEVPLARGLHKYSVVLPAAALRDGTDVLKFRYAYARSPRDARSGSADTRELAVAWYSINFGAPR